jgi:hypothetical protein
LRLQPKERSGDVTEQNGRPEHGRIDWPAGSDAGKRGGQFRREGPPPADGTGRSVDEMNRIAEDSVVNNVTPDEATD